MRRILLGAAIAVAIPAIVLAITTNAGQVVEVTNYNTTTGASYINAAMCAGTAQIQLQWTIQPLSSTTFVGTDIYKIYASNIAPSTTSTGTTTANFCPENDDGATVHAGSVGSVSASNSIGTTSVAASDVSSKTTIACTSGSENAVVYLCAHWYDSTATTKKGFASGTFLVQIAAPNAPTGVGVDPGDSKLVVSWAANGSTPTTTDHYVARAFLPGGTTPVSTATTSGGTTSATITGLSNGTTYEIDVVAVSLGGNPSAASTPRLSAAPVPTADFWAVYKDRGGQEQGGCGAGSGGVLSLLGAATFAALRRRKA